MILQSADSVVISAFLGITVLAVYQNYYFILSAVLAIIEIIVSSITAGLGNSFQTETQAKNFADMQKFTFMYLWLTGTCACCFLGMYQPFMQIWVGTELMLGNGMVVCLAVYFFMYTLNRLLNTYKDAAGLWHVDRWRPLVTAMVNLGLNLLTVRWLGLYGVVLSTIASWLFVGIPWLLRNLFSKLFDASLLKCFLHMMLRFMLWTASAGSMVAFVCARITLSPWLTLLLCCGISVLIPTIVFFVVYRKDEPFRQAVVFADRLTKGKLQLEKRLVK